MGAGEKIGVDVALVVLIIVLIWMRLRRNNNHNEHRAMPTYKFEIGRPCFFFSPLSGTCREGRTSSPENCQSVTASTSIV